MGGWNRSVYLPDVEAPLREVGRADLADAVAQALRGKRRRQYSFGGSCAARSAS